MSQTQDLTEKNLQGVHDGTDQPQPNTAPSVSGSTARRDLRRASGRFPVNTGEYRRYSGQAGYNPGNGGPAGGDSEGDEFDDNNPPEPAPTARGEARPTTNPTSPPPVPQPIPQTRAGPSTTARAPAQAPTRPRRAARDNPPSDEGDTNLTQAQNDLLAELEEINGQDSYDALTAGIGKLKRTEYLVLPLGFQAGNVPARLVGTPAGHAMMTVNDWAQVYVLNKAVTPDGVDAVLFGFLRMEAVKAGWYTDQREVVFNAPANDALRVMINDFGTVRDKLDRLKTAAFIVPLVAEQIGRAHV